MFTGKLASVYLASIGLATLVACGQAQTVCRMQGDIAFVVDSSGSINNRDPGNWDLIKSFLKSIVDRLHVGEEDTRVSLVRFSNRGKLEFNLGEYFEASDIKKGIDDMRYADGNTNTSGGLYVMIHEVFNRMEESGDRPEVEDRAIVITDGESTRDQHLTLPYATEAKDKGITILAIGVTEEANTEELEGIASISPLGQPYIYQVADFNVLPDIVDSLVTQTCYQLTTTTTPLPRSPDCEEIVDLIIILDSSGSVGQANFDHVKSWVGQLILGLDVDNGVVNVGLLVFSSSETVVFHMDRHSSRSGMLEDLANVRYMRGTTNTAGALQYARQTMFSRSNGDREDVKNIVLLVTSGDSDDREETILEARLMKDEGVHILVTVVGNWFTMEEMNAIASHPYEENRFHLDEYEDLNEEFKDMLQGLVCNRLDECSSNPCRNALRCVDGVGYFACQCSEGYGGATCSQRCEEPADVIFALDSSGSIGRQNFEIMLDFVRDIVQGLRIGDDESSQASRVGLITFSDDVHKQFDLDEYGNKYDILNAFPSYYNGGASDTAKAIRYMREEMFIRDAGDQSGVRNIAVIITDGRSNDEMETWQEAIQARQQGIHLISVGIGRSVRMRELQGIASYPNEAGKNVLVVDEFEDLRDIEEELVDALCNNENECSSGRCRNGGTCEDLINGYRCRCTDRYTGEICDRECSGKADVAFVIDASGSIRRERFVVVLAFVENIIKLMEVASDKTRIGVVSWSDDVTLDFALDAYSSKQDILQALKYVQYRGGRTHTASALNMMRMELFGRSGDREDVPNYAYVITDGNSNVNQRNTIQEAIAAKISAIHIMTVSIGTHLNVIELKGIASEDTDTNMFSVESFVDLDDLTELMPQLICNDVDECSSDPCRNGGTCVDGLQRYICLCREGQTGDNCQFSCSAQLDICFVLDLSGSTEEHYERTIEFTRDLVHNLDMSFGRARFAAVVYGDEATIEFYLDSYSDKNEVLTAITFMPDLGRTNTQAGIRTMRSDVFTRTRGDRSGVPNVAVLVTDGNSNIEREDTVPEAERAKRDGITLYVVALGDAVDLGEVNAIAGTSSGSSAGDYVFRVTDNDSTAEVAGQLAEELCQ